jgi:hypothetical protein
MKSGFSFTTVRSFEPASTDPGLANRCVAGLSDELGERVVVLDDRREPSLELLRFRSSLTTIPGFEVALRRRVELLRQFRHASFGAPPAVEYLGADRRLILLSSHTEGTRLRGVVEHARGPAFASSLIQQLTPALAAFHQYGSNIGHGALTASRVVISPGGQLIIVEHVLGPALERLQLTTERMLVDLGLPVPDPGTGNRFRIDARTDFFQLGLIALSILRGRQLRPDEYRENLRHVLDEAIAASESESAGPLGGLRDWLERALQLDGRAFPSSEDALKALHDVANVGVRGHATQLWHNVVEETAFLEEIAPAVLPDLEPDDPVIVVTPIDAPSVALQPPEESAPTSLQSITEPRAIPASEVQATEELEEQPMQQPQTVWSAPKTNVQSPPPSRPKWSPPVFFRKPNGYLHWAIAALAICAIAEAVVIAMLLRGRWVAPAPVRMADVKLETSDPGATVVVDGQSAGVTPLQLKIGPDVRSISVASPRPAAPTPEAVVGSTGKENLDPGGGREPVAAARSGNAPAAVPAPQRLGGIRLSSPIALEVFEGDTRLGSSATEIVSASVGRHELDLVNSALGFKSRQVVEVKAGRVVSLVVTPPNGRININAVPWAEVLIDGKSVGETPLGNLSIPLGEHEIVFRHPQLGEQRRTATVRSDTITRVTVNLER